MPDQKQPRTDAVRSVVREILGQELGIKPEPARPGGGLAWMDDAEPDLPPGTSSGWARPGAKPRVDNADVEQARHIQQLLLPPPPRQQGLSCAARFEPHHEVSGDFYDFIQLSPTRIAIVQGDVSGHGVAAGMVMAMAMQTIRMLATVESTPIEVLTAANHWLCGHMAGKFVSVSYMTINLANGELVFARAGHTPCVLVNAATGIRDVLLPKGIAIGIRDGDAFASNMEEQRRRLRPGDMLVMVTDGILEAKNREHDEFGIERMTEVIAQHALAGTDAVVNRILDAARHFQGSAKLDDDAMAMAISLG
ncbi:MAG: SpoIIE family protein phosphatase [Planctomycetota bacterium]